MSGTNELKQPPRSSCYDQAAIFLLVCAGNSPTVTAREVVKRSVSLITWTPLWRSVISLLANWKSWHHTGPHGEVPARLGLMHHDRLQQIAYTISPPPCQWSVLPKVQQSVHLRIRSRKSSSKSQADTVAQRLRQIDRQPQGKAMQVWFSHSRPDYSYNVLREQMTTTNSFYGPWSRTTRLSQHQKHSWFHPLLIIALITLINSP